ncbi:MAG: GAF domain-containing protein, partial [Candidatus Tumulicola sp.]
MTRQDVRWKWLLLSLCGLSLLTTFAVTADIFGLGGRPWFGWWDAIHVVTGRPFTVGIAGLRPAGASALAGLRTGDRIDLRDQVPEARIGILYQPLATKAMRLHVTRGAQTLDIRVMPSTVWASETFLKVPLLLAEVVGSVWFFLCALLISLRRWWNHDARMLALVVLGLTFTLLNPTQIVTPNAALRLGLFAVASASWLAVLALLIALASRFGVRSRVRRLLEAVAYAAALLVFLADVATIAGLATVRFDPLPYAMIVSPLRGILELIAGIVVVVAVSVAIAKTPRAERPRAAWLLLPLPLALVGRDLALMLASFVSSWFVNISVIMIGVACMLAGAFSVTYALLRRRVLDIEFVVSRALVVATVSLIVVASFALLEWTLGTVVTGVSHATGLIANGALALALGLSLNPIHKRVDAIVDGVLFRKRRDDERALRDFSKEAAYVTDPAALLDQAIDKVRRHTDARSAALLLDGDGTFAAARTFGDDAPAGVGENDGAILALKTWHKPLDPHLYSTALRGAVALPMLARGRLLGIVLLGERAGGEAYAPDEVEALSQFAHGIGAALDSLSRDRDVSSATLRAIA